MAPAATAPARALPPHIAAVQLLPLLATNFAQSVMITLPFSVGVYMVRSWAPGAGEDAVGRMAGLMAAAFSLSQATTSYAWGAWSSRCGRKPVMVVGSATSAAAVLWFGASPSYASACAARMAGGLLNGIIVAWKCIIGESCAPLGQGRAMSWMSLSWGVGSIVGPLAGGLLSQPCSSISPGSAGANGMEPSAAAAAVAAGGGLLARLAGPLCDEGALLQTRPYLLPCLVVAALNAAACLLNVLLLRESLPALRHDTPGDSWLTSCSGMAWPKAWWRRLPYERLSTAVHEHRSSGRGEAGGSQEGCGPAAAQSAAGALELGRMDSAAECAGHAPRSYPAAKKPHFAEAASLPEHQEAAVSRVDSEWMMHHSKAASAGGCCSIDISGVASGRSDSGGSISGDPCGDGGRGVDRSDSAGQSQGTAGACALLPDQPPDRSGEGCERGNDPWYSDREVVLAVLIYGGVCLLYIMLDEVTPMFASAPVSRGGLGMSEAELAGPLVLGGLVLIVFSVAGFPRLQKWFGALLVGRTGLLLSAAVAAAIPAASFMTSSAAGEAVAAAATPDTSVPGDARMPASQGSLATLACLMAIKAIAQSCAFTSFMIIVNTLPQPEHLGSVNGAGQTLASFTRGLGPLTGGLLWGLASHVHGGQFLVFVVIAGVALGAWALCRQLKSDV